MKEAKIKFKVEKSWLIKNSFLAEEVILKRYVKSWEKLPTKYLNGDKDFVYYEAETKGFSYFVITAEKKPAPIITSEVVEETPKEELEAKPVQIAPTGKTNYLVYILLIALTIMIVIAFWKRKTILAQKENLEKFPVLNHFMIKHKAAMFCKEQLQQGYTEKQIIKAAKQSGWDEEVIKGILKGLKK